MPETGQPPYDWDRANEIAAANRKPAESLADRLKREAAAAAAKRDAEAAAAREAAEREALAAFARADRLYTQLRSLEGVWLGNVPALDVLAGGSGRVRRHVGQVVVRLRTHAHDHNGCRRTRHGVGLVLHNYTGRNAVALRLVDWVTGWVDPKGHHGGAFLTPRWVIDDYNSPMAKLPLLMGQKPRTEEEAVELTLDLLREFVLPDPPPGAEPAEPGVTPTRPGLDL